ncbi:MAG: aminoglycoside phosphotransferase family protein [Desulfovibrio sp.]|jgi:aminoglycoside phosphotransferase (APT) family kinase protein|nr:aminoglycoside phosphotransferase family protein [Desulfovibrio sp.]
MKLDTVIAARSNKTIYREGNVSVKLFNAGYSIADVLNEAHNHAIVEETGFLVPKLEEVSKIDGKWAIVTQFIEGKTLTQSMEENPAKTDVYLERMVDIQIAMHGYTAKKLRHHTDKMHERIDQSGLDQTMQYELHTRLSSLPKHSKLCHGDMNPDNVIINASGDAYVIDWSHATQGNASADAARTYLLFRIAGEDARSEQYLDFFCEKSGTSRQYVQKWLPLVAASQLVQDKPNEREFLLRWSNVVEY